MLRGNRVIYIVAVALILSMLYLFRSEPTPLKSDRKNNLHSSSKPKRIRYLSWLPHGDFAEQHEAFRNALRIALETKRTIIAPLLRIGRPYGWLPFDELAQRYEAQDKTMLKHACAKASFDQEWRTQLEPCDTISEWTEIPWSAIFNLEGLQREFGIRIIERVSGHGWGVRETALGGQLDYSDVTVIDPFTFANNGTSIEHNPPPDAVPPLKRYIKVKDLLKIDSTLIQLGSLSSASRYRTSRGKTANALNRALNKRLFIIPNHMASIQTASNQIVDALGGTGAYSTLFINIEKYVSLTTGNSSITLETLPSEERKQIMDGVVLELFGDIPINQAISAAMPIAQPSRLYDLLQSTGRLDRHELLQACVSYRRTKDSRYPIYYLATDIDKRPYDHLDLFGSLLARFPCVFTMHDMYDWGIVDRQWVHPTRELMDTTVQYERVLKPILDILMASRGYAFFEIPQTALTRFMSWQPKNHPPDTNPPPSL